MAIAGTAVFEFRATATPNMVNGGGFVPGGGGTDFSLQDTAQYTFSDLATTSGTTVPAVVTSASHSFVAADVGNIMHITAGTSWTPGWYQIVSVSGGAATLDKACGTVATLTAGTYFVGGAFNTGSATLDSTFFATFAPVGATCWWKKGTYTIGTLVIAKANSAVLPLTMNGYTTARGDKPTDPTQMPLLDFGVNGWNGGNNTIFNNLYLRGGITGALFTNGGFSVLDTCKLEVNGASTGLVTISSANTGLTLKNCEIIGYRGVGISFSGSGNAGFYALGCYIHDCATGVAISTATASIIECLIEGCYTAGITISGSTGCHINGNTIYGSQTPVGTGISVGNGSSRHSVIDNILYGLAAGINDATAGNVLVSIYDYNNFFNNTADRVGVTVVGANDKALDPAFANVTQLAGTTATVAATSVLTDAAQNFSNVIDNSTYCYISGGTGATVGKYLITAHTTTTVTLSPTLTTSAVADKIYKITLGKNFNVGVAMQGIAFPTSYLGGNTTSYGDLGTSQRNPTADYTDPGVGHVEIGTTYLFSTLTKTGTYTGANRWSDPGIANVLSTISYNANNVGVTGTYVVATAGNVKIGTAFGAASALTGTYDGSDRWTNPGIANVRAGTAYKNNSTSNNATGTLDLPAITDVQINVVYDNTTKTGTYDGSNRWTSFLPADVRSGVAYKDNSPTNNKVGVYAPVSLPQVLVSGLGIDGTNHLNGSLWVNRDSFLITTGLGKCAFEIFHPDGTTTGISQTNISDTGGLFFITPVSVTSLLGTPNYLLKITITVNSVDYMTYQPMSLVVSGGGTDLSPVQTVVDAIKLKTDNLPSDPADESIIIAAADGIVALLGTPAGADLAHDIAAIKADTASTLTRANGIKAKTDLLSFTDTNVNAIANLVGDKSGYSLAAASIPIKKNTAFPGMSFPLYDTSGVALTGATVVAKRSIDGGSLANCTNSVTEIGSGLYKIDLAAADLNGNSITFVFTATGAKETSFTAITQ